MPAPILPPDRIDARAPGARRAAASTWTPQIESGRCRDLPILLQLVQDAAADRNLNPQYLQWPYAIGLARMLLGAILFKRTRNEHGRLVRSQVQVIRQGTSVLAFSLVRALPPSATGQAGRELYLLCVERGARRQGIATALTKHAQGELSASQHLLVHTLSSCQAMARLMRKMQASAVPAAGLQRPSHSAPTRTYTLLASAETPGQLKPR